MVSIDFGKQNAKYLQNIEDNTIALVFDPEVFFTIPKSYNGAKFSFNLPGKALCDWFKVMVKDKGQIAAVVLKTARPRG